MTLFLPSHLPSDKTSVCVLIIQTNPTCLVIPLMITCLHFAYHLFVSGFN